MEFTEPKNEKDDEVKPDSKPVNETISPVIPNARVCRYFQRGMCNKGDNCTFSHEIKSSNNNTAMSDPTYIPRPVIINIPPGTASIFSIDVECVAIGLIILYETITIIYIEKCYD